MANDDSIVSVRKERVCKISRFLALPAGPAADRDDDCASATFSQEKEIVLPVALS